MLGLFRKKGKLISKEFIEDQKEKVSDIKEALELLNSFSINIDNLALGRIQTESEAMNHYVRGIIKDLHMYANTKDQKEKLEHTMKAISSKIKFVSIHGLELKNMLGNLENHYY